MAVLASRAACSQRGARVILAVFVTPGSSVLRLTFGRTSSTVCASVKACLAALTLSCAFCKASS